MVFRDDFSPERAVADLVEGLELQRTNAQLWCLYLELSSWHMSSEDLQHLCNAAVKNSQSYDLFWTVKKGKIFNRKISYESIRSSIYVQTILMISFQSI